jgi:molybdopterin-guanine dinucleotide biosynthesis protein A
MTRIAGLVMAGGGARRMGGGDKPLLDLGGQTMLARVIARIGLPDIAIGANGDPSRFAAFGLPVLDDGPFVGEGPLAGVLAGLDWAAGRGASVLLTVPGDTPFIPTGLAAALAPSPACAERFGQAHHLVALWPVSRRESLRTLLSAPGRRDIHRFALAIGMRRVDFPMGKWDPFTNINTPEELAVARAILDELGTEGWA